MNRKKLVVVGAAWLFLSASPTVRPTAVLPACDPDNGGITLPAGFCAVVVADQVGAPRHLAVAPNGDLFVAMAGGRGGTGGILALRDTSRDGKADVQQSIGSEGGTGIALGKGTLYFGTASTVYRYALRAGSLAQIGRAHV